MLLDQRKRNRHVGAELNERLLCSLPAATRLRDVDTEDEGGRSYEVLSERANAGAIQKLVELHLGRTRSSQAAACTQVRNEIRSLPGCG